MSSRTGKASSDKLLTIEGVLDRLVFSSDSSDFIVGKLIVRGRRDPVAIVGSLAAPHPGETLILHGGWEVDKKFGEQFRFERAESKVPSTVAGIEKYLSSNLVKGIGPEMARRITAMFGEATLDVIESEPDRLLEVPGIGKNRAEGISRAFQDQKSIREVMLFLQTHGVSPAYAFRIFKRYGRAAIDVVSRNPYRLATDIRGIGFHSADKVAGSLGVDMKSAVRAEAGLLHVLDTAQSEGHVYYPRARLLERTARLLTIGEAVLEKALAELARRRQIVEEDDRIYPALSAFQENAVADRLRELLTAPRMAPPINIPVALQWIAGRSGIMLSDAQQEAVSAALEHKALIITGGPGTGKTTLQKALIDILDAKKITVLLAAPTGRAAKRLSEATGREAKTVHRLLEFSPAEGGFQRTAERPLEADVVVVDETSMMDLALTHHLLAAIPAEASLLLVGDADQLPSVGPGNVLGDLIDSGAIPTVRLQTIFRQAKSSLIVTNAHLVNRGEMPLKGTETDDLSDFYFIDKDDAEEAVDIITRMVTDRIPGRFGIDPRKDAQILSPMRRGPLGTDNLNRVMRDALNPDGQRLKGDRFRVGDRVMQTRNNYEKEVFNGDVGRIVSYDSEWDELTIDFGAREVIYHVSETDEIIPAYAVTIHKSQGSEYPVVVVPLSTQHYVLLRRNLLYTALTRGKRLVVLVGSERALRMAVENAAVEPRYTGLAEKLRR